MTKLQDSQRETIAAFAETRLLLNCEHSAITKATEAGLTKATVNALKAGLAVLKRKRVGRVWDLNPVKSFEAVGITLGA